jgi:ubiquinone/menaquinone biosynthesis C-methylase UbiE
MPAKKRTGETATRLPAQPPRLLGRESDLEAIQSVLRREEVRLLTLTGPAGVGKTRLAIEVGTRMSGDFAQGVMLVDLSQIRALEMTNSARKEISRDGTRPRGKAKLFERSTDKMTTPQTPDLTAIKEKQQKTWASGNYAVIGNQLVIMGERLCEAVDVRSGQKVLDVATGSGNTAISAARRYCEATGIDYVPELIEQAEERARAEELEVTFEVGDAENLPYPDASFDAVLSTVGVMFAPNQEKAAGELLRVCKPGGKIGLANWTPDGFIGEMFRTVGKHVPPPPGIKPPPLWGTEEQLREILGEGISSLHTARRSYSFRYLSAEHFIDTFRTYYGPVHKAFEVLDEAGQDAFARDLTELIHAWDASGDATAVLPSDYLEVVAVRR